jgi:pantoate--beta-alanine ligase
MSVPRRITTIPALRAAVAEARRDGARIGFVPTMGALHAGHLALVDHAHQHADVVVVSIFVNPTQFDVAADLAAYPRDLAADEAALSALEPPPALVFAPAVDELYPRPPVTTVSVGRLTERLCGGSRPGHFDGVATVVTKLLNLVAPDVAVFGRKDRQQLEVIRRLVADLDLDVEVIGAPTVRDADGLALSSRNRRLDADQRQRATALSRALHAAVLAGRAMPGALDADVVRSAALAVLADAPGVGLDYLEVVVPDTLQPPDEVRARLLVAIAAYVGSVRLIDNVELGDPDDEAPLVAAVS